VSVRDQLAARRAERDAFLDRATALLMADTRIAAAWLTGSLGRGDGDSLSDIDLWVIVADDHCPRVTEERRTFIAQLGRPLLIQDAPRNAPPAGAFLLVLYESGAGHLQVDWQWQPQSHARVPPDAHVLFDRAGIPSVRPPAPPTAQERAAALTDQAIFFWAMSAIAAKKIARRQLRAALRMIAMVEQTLGEMQWRCDLRDSPPGVEDRRTSPPPIEPAAQLAALRAITDAMRSLSPHLKTRGADTQDAVVPHIYHFFDLVAAISQEVTPPL
jgi:predicted nucleotidyltransferase